MQVLEKSIAFIILILLLQSCEKPYYDELKTVQTWHLSYEDPSHIQKGSLARPFAGKGFNRINKDRKYGDDLFYVLPDSLNEKDIRICIDGYLRSEELRTSNTIAISLDKEGTVHWQCFWLKDVFADTGVWTHWCDSTQLPVDINRVKGARLAVSAVSFGKGKYFDLDEMKVTLKLVTRVNRK